MLPATRLHSCCNTPHARCRECMQQKPAHGRACCACLHQARARIGREAPMLTACSVQPMHAPEGAPHLQWQHSLLGHSAVQLAGLIEQGVELRSRVLAVRPTWVEHSAHNVGSHHARARCCRPLRSCACTQVDCLSSENVQNACAGRIHAVLHCSRSVQAACGQQQQTVVSAANVGCGVHRDASLLHSKARTSRVHRKALREPDSCQRSCCDEYREQSIHPDGRCPARRCAQA